MRVGWKGWMILGVSACAEGGDSDAPTDVGPEPACTAPAEVACQDDLLLDLGLHDTVSAGGVSSAADGNDWRTTVDATAGGFAAAAQNPWTYLRFTDAGAEKVEIDDVSALGSMDWHLAAHRFKLRLNGGSGGPSCVSAAALIDATYADVTLADAEGASFFEDDFMTASCDFINDSSGLEGSPQVALGPWWSYPGCVATTGTPFLIRLDSGRTLKLEVLAYYGSGQDDCNTSNVPGQDSGMFELQWTFLD